MNKSELIDAIASGADVSKASLEELLILLSVQLQVLKVETLFH